MRGRICLVGAAVCALPLASGISAATAAGNSPASAIKITCTTSVGVTIASGETTVVPPVQKGQEYGSAKCGKLLGGGVQQDSFNDPGTGDILATFRIYLSTGSIHGKYVLIPQEGSFGTNFSEVDSVGKLKVTGGTGTFAGARGTGKMTCKTPDSIHTTCTDKLKLNQL